MFFTKAGVLPVVGHICDTCAIGRFVLTTVYQSGHVVVTVADRAIITRFSTFLLVELRGLHFQHESLVLLVVVAVTKQ